MTTTTSFLDRITDPSFMINRWVYSSGDFFLFFVKLAVCWLFLAGAWILGWFTGQSRRYWQWILSVITPLVSALKLMGPPSRQPIPDGHVIAYCFYSALDVLYVNRLIKGDKVIMYPANFIRTTRFWRLITMGQLRSVICLPGNVFFTLVLTIMCHYAGFIPQFNQPPVRHNNLLDRLTQRCQQGKGLVVCFPLHDPRDRLIDDNHDTALRVWQVSPGPIAVLCSRGGNMLTPYRSIWGPWQWVSVQWQLTMIERPDGEPTVRAAQLMVQQVNEVLTKIRTEASS